MKNLAKISGVKALNKHEQKLVFGGYDPIDGIGNGNNNNGGGNDGGLPPGYGVCIENGEPIVTHCDDMCSYGHQPLCY